jgi:hypothetical protein
MRGGIPDRYQEAIKYYAECAGGDPYIGVEYGSVRQNVTKCEDQKGAWSKQTISKGYRFPMLGEILTAPPSKSKGHVHVVQLPQCRATGKHLYLDATNCLVDIGYLHGLKKSAKMSCPWAIGPAINCPLLGGKANVKFATPPEEEGLITAQKIDVQYLEILEDIPPETELLVDYGGDVPMAKADEDVLSREQEPLQSTSSKRKRTHGDKFRRKRGNKKKKQQSRC